jgi:hypothetical protein
MPPRRTGDTGYLSIELIEAENGYNQHVKPHTFAQLSHALLTVAQSFVCDVPPLYPPDAVQGSRDRLGAVLSPVPSFEGFVAC